MTYLEAEKKLVLFLAGVLDLSPDRDIFAGTLPEGVQEGITAELVSGEPAALNNTNIFTARICGRSLSRKKSRQYAHALVSVLPVFGKAGLLSVRVKEEVPLKFAEDRSTGACLHTFSLDLCVSFI